MLEYIRRSEEDRVHPNFTRTNKSQREIDMEKNPILVYCNWSFSRRYHISLPTLIRSLLKFNRRMTPFYARIFNETPIGTIASFIDNNHLSDELLHYIWNRLSTIKGIPLREEFWGEYNKYRENVI